MFDSVSTPNQIKLSDLEFTPTRNDNIQIFDENGDVVKMITYRRRGKAGSYEYYWQLDDLTDPDNPVSEEITDFVFTRGNSFWLAFNNAIDFTQSGAVNTNAVVYTIPGGQAFVQAGNPRPVALKLSEIQFSNLARNDNIQIFDANGDVVKMYTYRRRGKSGSYEYYWQLDDLTDPDNPVSEEVDPANVQFPAGQAFWFALNDAGTVTIPGITL